MNNNQCHNGPDLSCPKVGPWPDLAHRARRPWFQQNAATSYATDSSIVSYHIAS